MNTYITLSQWDDWVFVNRLAGFLDDMSLKNLSMVNRSLYNYTNENTIWKRRCLKYNITNDKIKNFSWKELYIKYRPIYVNPKYTRKYHIEYKNHPSGCFLRSLSSSNSSLVVNTSYKIIELDMEYYVTSIDKGNMKAYLVVLREDEGIKYYTRDKITKFSISKSEGLFKIYPYIKGTGLLVMPWSDIIENSKN